MDDSESVSMTNPNPRDLQDQEEEEEELPLSQELSRLERWGVWIETSMTSFFTQWGVTCAKYPIPVIVLSVGFAAGLCTGIQWLKVETDPVELWAAPQSRSRIEKNYFDQVFRPFYRTQQVIVHAKDLDNVRSTTESGFWNIFRTVLRSLALASPI